MSLPIPLWGEVGATLARLGASLDLSFRDDIEPLDLELPLTGGKGRAPEAIEARRQAAAVVRLLYDDVFSYQGDEPPADPREEAPVDATEPAPSPVEVQAFDRKTGQPIKVRVNMVPAGASAPRAG